MARDSNYRGMRTITKLLAIAILIGFTYVLISPNHVGAYTPDQLPGGLKSAISNYDPGCASNPKKYAIDAWIAQRGAPANNSTITVPYGTTDVPLEFDSHIFLCHTIVLVDNNRPYAGLPNDGNPTTAKLTSNSRYIDSISVSPSGGIANSPAGSNSTVFFNGGTRYWFANPLNFDYVSAPLTSSITITIHVVSTDINNFKKGTLVCGANGAPARGAPPTYGCPSDNSDFSLLINVLPPPNRPPTGSITGDCNNVWGTASDPDTPGQPVSVDVYVDQPAGAPGSTPVAGGIQANPNWSQSIAAYASLSARTFYAYAHDTTTGAPVFLGSVTPGPCASPSCGRISSSPALPQPGENFSVTATFNASIGNSGIPANYKIRLSMSGPGVVTIPPPNPQGPFTIPPGGSGGSATWNPVTASAAGTYPGAYDVSGDINLHCPFTTIPPPGTVCTTGDCEPLVVNEPYFRAYGSDVISGIRPTGICRGWSSVANSTINAYNDGTGIGAGGQLAALALGVINGFSSSTGQTFTPGGGPGGYSGVSGNLLPSYLTFANRGSGTFGGLAGFAPCPYDYFKDASSATPSGAPGLGLTGLDPSTLPNGNYVYDTGLLGLGSGLKIKGATLPANTKITIYVNGNVTICGNLTYATGGWAVKNIPSFYVIAKGNIYVQAPGTSCGLLGFGGGSGVNQLDGVYIAQQGKFYSCADITLFPSPPSANFINTKCNSNLTINGAVIAQQIRLFRVNGTQFKGSANGGPNELSNSGNIAEMFNAGPETWLTVPAPFTTNPIDGYDAITGLPPIL